MRACVKEIYKQVEQRGKGKGYVLEMCTEKIIVIAAVNTWMSEILYLIKFRVISINQAQRDTCMPPDLHTELNTQNGERKNKYAKAPMHPLFQYARLSRAHIQPKTGTLLH